ncbi:nucleoside monophosphate kinase [Candidatus Saccharibacteria bacterium]|nr:nucleoside monophosphate kinase [Candidatus Saccharibacteria bacterium]
MIIFLGLAGSGKSTQSELLAKSLDCPRISIGDLLRSTMDGQEAQRMLAGELIEDEKWLPLLDNQLRERAGKEFILDGSPRTIEQARWLVDKVSYHKIIAPIVIHLNAKKDVVKERLLARGRPDDYEAAIAERFAEYENKIKPILNYLSEEGFRVYDINGEQTKETVESEIREAIQGKATTHEGQVTN